jgi:uncharacterized GH25 family protein
MKIMIKFILVVIVLMHARGAFAHDGWIEVSPGIVEKGQIVTISLFLGNHSNEHKSYRLAGKWQPEYTRLMAVDPSGRLTDITGSLVDLGEHEEKTGPKGPKGFHIAQLPAKEEGLYAVLGRQERTVQNDGMAVRSMRTARTYFGAFAVPTLAGAKRLGWPSQQAVLNDALEILPVANPLAAGDQGPITLLVRHKGNPAPNKTVSVIRKMGGPASAQELTTDAQGYVRISPGPADFYLARVKFDEEGTNAEGKKEKTSYEGTFVFQIFNRP